MNLNTTEHSNIYSYYLLRVYHNNHNKIIINYCKLQGKPN